MNASLQYPVATGNTLTLLQYLPFSKCETSGSQKSVFIWAIGAIPQPLGKVRLEVQTNQNQLPQTLMEALLSCESYDQLTFLMETMRIESLDYSIQITHSSHTPPSKQQTLLMSLSSKWVAAASRTTECFSNLFSVMLPSRTGLSITKIAQGIWQRCMAARSSLDTLIERRLERVARSRKAQAIAWGRLRAEVRWIMQKQGEQPLAGDKDLSSERSGLKTPQSGL